MALKLICWMIATPHGTFGYFRGDPKGPKGVGGGSGLSEFIQRVNKKLSKKIQTLKLSRTYIVSVSIWPKILFAE